MFERRHFFPIKIDHFSCRKMHMHCFVLYFGTSEDPFIVLLVQCLSLLDNYHRKQNNANLCLIQVIAVITHYKISHVPNVEFYLLTISTCSTTCGTSQFHQGYYAEFHLWQAKCTLSSSSSVEDQSTHDSQHTRVPMIHNTPEYP